MNPAIVLALCLGLAVVVSARPAEEKEYPLKYQPEFDSLDISTYLKNPRNLNFQIKCLLYDGPCDAVGRWAKPRAKAGLLGECLKCTEKQKVWLKEWTDILIKERPDLYRASLAKYLFNTGVEIPEEELTKIKSTVDKLEKEAKASENTDSKTKI